jgi:hypothetical protein
MFLTKGASAGEYYFHDSNQLAIEKQTGVTTKITKSTQT